MSEDIREGEIAAALDGVAACTHLVLLYFMDRARRDLLVQAPRHGERRGTFALRSPVRPNPIAMSVARLVRVEGTTLIAIGFGRTGERSAKVPRREPWRGACTRRSRRARSMK